MLRTSFFLVFCFLFTSCSIDEQISENDFDNNIDTSILEGNNWGMSNSIWDYINSHRTSIEKPALIKDTLYASAYALQHTQYMISMNTVNHHHFFLRSNALKQHGAITVSETVAYGYHSPSSVVNAWLNSNSHKNILEGDYTHLGLGVQQSSIEGNFYITFL